MIIPLSKDISTEMTKYGLASYDPASDMFYRIGQIDTVRVVSRADGVSELVLYSGGKPVVGLCLARTEAADIARKLLDLPHEGEGEGDRRVNLWGVPSREHDLLPLFD